MSFRDADGFFELEHCTHCQDNPILSEEELAEFVDTRNSAWYDIDDE